MGITGVSRPQGKEIGPAPNIRSTDSIDVSLSENEVVSFHYDARVANIALPKLQKVSDYFDVFFQKIWSKDSRKFTLEKPVDENFSPAFFINLIQAYAKPAPELELNTDDTILKTHSLIRFYGFKNPLKLTPTFPITYANVEDLADLEPFLDSRQVVQCCQVLLDEPDFLEAYLLSHHQNRNSFAKSVLRKLDFFDQFKNQITNLKIVLVYDKEERVEARATQTEPDRLYCALGAIDFFTNPCNLRKLELFVSLFPNIEMLELDLNESNICKHQELEHYFLDCTDPDDLRGVLNKLFFDRLANLKVFKIPINPEEFFVLKFMNKKSYALEFCIDGLIIIYTREQDALKPGFVISKSKRWLGVDSTTKQRFGETVSPDLILEFLPFPPTPELLEGIDESFIPWTEEGTLDPDWFVCKTS
ncbi:MAG TPA: hypothetical protein VIJ14_05805 [Rhabdochlamydiaceae bacterium]